MFLLTFDEKRLSSTIMYVVLLGNIQFGLIFQGRGIKIGRGRGNLIQTKLTLAPGATMVPLLEQLVVPGHSVSLVFFIYN